MTMSATNVSVEVDYANDAMSAEAYAFAYASDDVAIVATTNDVGQPALRLTGPATSVWAALVVWAGGDEDVASEVMNDAS